jgi:ABC-type thiamin/hydroxymethylpyrimidine transport system permease subunit
MEHSTGASYYEFDVAEDSNFQHFVAGYAARPALRSATSEQILLVEGVLPKKHYYVRVRGINNQGRGLYSTTAIVTTSFSTGVSLLSIRNVTDSSATVRWTPAYYRDNNRQARVASQQILRLMDNENIVSTATRTLHTSQDTIFEAWFARLSPNKGFVAILEGQDSLRIVLGGSSSSKGFRTFKNREGINAFKQWIEIGEWLRITPETNYALYFRFASIDRPSTVEHIDSILSEMWQAGLPLDTVWFHTDGTIVREYGASRMFGRGAECVIKLKRSDHRVLRWGVQQGLASPRFSLEYQYYRYVFPERVMSAVGGSVASMMTMNVHPQPASSEIIVCVDVLRACSLGLTMVDVLGRSVVSLPVQAYTAGQHSIMLNVVDLPSGVYSVRVQSSDRSVLQQQLVIRK